LRATATPLVGDAPRLWAGGSVGGEETARIERGFGAPTIRGLNNTVMSQRAVSFVVSHEGRSAESMSSAVSRAVESRFPIFSVQQYVSVGHLAERVGCQKKETLHGLLRRAGKEQCADVPNPLPLIEDPAPTRLAVFIESQLGDLQI